MHAENALKISLKIWVDFDFTTIILVGRTSPSRAAEKCKKTSLSNQPTGSKTLADGTDEAWVKLCPFSSFFKKRYFIFYGMVKCLSKSTTFLSVSTPWCVLISDQRDSSSALWNSRQLSGWWKTLYRCIHAQNLGCSDELWNDLIIYSRHTIRN